MRAQRNTAQGSVECQMFQCIALVGNWMGGSRIAGVDDGPMSTDPGGAALMPCSTWAQGAAPLVTRAGDGLDFCQQTRRV